MSVQQLTPDRFSPRRLEGLADLSSVRREFGRWLHDLGVDDEVIDDLLVVVSELAANAVRESAHDGHSPTVTARRRPGAVELVVENEIDIEVHTPPNADWDLEDPLRTGGRGLMVVSALVDDVEVDVDGRRLLVRCTVGI